MLLQHFSTQEHSVDIITHDESAGVLSWKGESLEEYWGCILNALIYPDDDGECHKPDLVVYYGGDMNLLINKGMNSDDLFLKDGTIPDLRSTETSVFNIFRTIIKHQLEDG